MSPLTPFGHAKRLLVGRPISSELAHHERLTKTTGLAVLSSDALSSVAYATEEVLRVLMVGGLAAMAYAPTIALLIATLLAIVAFSYRQTIKAYPQGGGAYIVAKENLGEWAGLSAAAALLIDYTLTVAVSVAAGVAAITSAFPSLHINRVELGLVFVGLLMLVNLRGVRESARLFALPTYGFIGVMLTLIAAGFYRTLAASVPPVAAVPSDALPTFDTATLTTFALLTAFANGCTAMTGVEAISDGTPAFRPPEARNAAATLLIMAAVAITMFVGISVLADRLHTVPAVSETIVSQIGRAVFGGGTALYYVLQVMTTLILVLAANTAYADFPRLASIVARDRFMPRQFMNQGDKLAFSNGIIALSAAAGGLIVVFGGDTHQLIPLYMIGVFLSFTLSQTGMFLKQRRADASGPPVFLNLFGAILTGIVLLIVGATKGPEGAWIVIVLIPCLVVVFKKTREHYDTVAHQLTLRNWTPPARRTNIVLVPVSGVQRAVVHALRYAESISTDVRAVYVNDNPQAVAALQAEWKTWGGSVTLVVLDSPFRSVMEPLLAYIALIEKERTNAYITIVLPEFVPSRWWHHLLHNQRALLIKGALLFRPNVVVTSVPFHLS